MQTEFFTMRKTILYLLLTSLLLVSCNSYEKLLKSNDSLAKLEAAKKFYADKKYVKSITLLENIAPHFKGTDKSEEVLYLTAKVNFDNKDYFSASSYFGTYAKTFPRGEYADECWYMVGYCAYKDSPDTRLDQTPTIEAIQAFNEYLQIFPTGKHITDANKYLNELNEKLAYKAYLNAKLYYNLGNYLGNNYKSAVITANNAIQDYPNSKYREELAFLILKSKFEQAEMSVPAKKEKRYTETIDEYYSFTSEYPESKFSKEANRIATKATEFVKE